MGGHLQRICFLQSVRHVLTLRASLLVKHEIFTSAEQVRPLFSWIHHATGGPQCRLGSSGLHPCIIQVTPLARFFFSPFFFTPPSNPRSGTLGAQDICRGLYSCDLLVIGGIGNFHGFISLDLRGDGLFDQIVYYDWSKS